MVLIEDGSSEHVPKKIGFDESFDVTKYCQQIEIPNLIQVCAPCSELPFNISTKVNILYSIYYWDFLQTLDDIIFRYHK